MAVLQTLLAHRMVSVIQAVMRGVVVRKWFRASLMEASSRIGDRAYFKRLAAIGSSAKDVGQGGESMDILAQQVCFLDIIVPYQHQIMVFCFWFSGSL